MTDTVQTKRPSLSELTTEQPESRDPDYLAWKAAKIRQARDEAHRNPEKLISRAAMRARFGLED